MPRKPIAGALQILQEKFGYQDFRPGQRDAIESVLQHRDTLAVMPTGAGKSAIYQIPAVLMPGPTIVVSPLIALQKDQVERLASQDVGGAAVLNSVTRVREKREIFDELEHGELEFLFVTPEQLQKEDLLNELIAVEPSLFVVDEAHCISEWGHDFRPSYLGLSTVIAALGHPVVLALTATASGRVRDEIVTRLGMREPNIILQGFDRPNITLEVRSFPSETAKRDALLDAVEEAEKPGLVYVASRRHAEEIAAQLGDRGIDARFYHGGMPSKERHPVQDEFMSGQIPVVIATSAFGMGIDKPDVRFVFHFDVPHSVDSYYQEVGRAGRDGRPAKAVLFYRPEDLSIHKFFAGGQGSEGEKIEKVGAAVDRLIERHGLDAATPEAVAQATELPTKVVEKALRKIEAAPEEDPREAAHSAAAESDHQHELELERIERIRAYAEVLSCRREYLMAYFGAGSAPACRNCDNCFNGNAAREPAPVQTAGKTGLKEKTRITHATLGKGLVLESTEEKITILFDNGGARTLSLNVARELLTPA